MWAVQSGPCGQWKEQWVMWVVQSGPCGQWNEQWVMRVVKSGALWSMKWTVSDASCTVWCLVVNEMNSEWCELYSLGLVVYKMNSKWCELHSLVPCGQWNEQWVMWVVQSGALWSMKWTVSDVSCTVWCLVVNEMNSEWCELHSLVPCGQRSE